MAINSFAIASISFARLIARLNFNWICSFLVGILIRVEFLHRVRMSHLPELGSVYVCKHGLNGKINHECDKLKRNVFFFSSSFVHIRQWIVCRVYTHFHVETLRSGNRWFQWLKCGLDWIGLAVGLYALLRLYEYRLTFNSLKAVWMLGLLFFFLSLRIIKSRSYHFQTYTIFVVCCLRLILSS